MSKDNEKVIKVTQYGDKKDGGKSGAKIDIYSSDPKAGPHDSVHIKVNTDNKTYEAVTKINGEKESSSGSCYLTTACMKYMQEMFDDNCYELTVLRWFRDNFVSKEDIQHYYQIAPIIVEAIDKEEQNEVIYNYIYDNVVDYCVTQIENGNYIEAYNRYKSSILSFEETFAKPLLQQKTVKTLKKVIV